MAKGKAYGKPLEYQRLCRDVIRQLQIQNNLVPYSGDGVDVPFQICGTDVSFDIALKDSQGRLTVAECRKRKEPTKQEALFTFLAKVEHLRKELGTEVAGIFITKSRYQIGAVKLATEMDIDVVICDQNHTPQNFIISYKRYDSKREAVIQDIKAQLTANSQSSGELLVSVRRSNDSHTNT